MRLPVVLYRPKLLKLKGQVLIDSEKVYTGMIRLGDYTVSFYPNTGIVWENHGGTVVFKGNCRIGNASAVSVGKKGNLFFGSGFQATSALKIACYHKINFGDNVLIGWDNIFMDTNFHKIKKLDGEEFGRPYAEIKIGDRCWFGLKCTVMKGAEVPDNTIISGNTILNKTYNIPAYSVLAGIPANLKLSGVYRDLHDDNIEY